MSDTTEKDNAVVLFASVNFRSQSMRFGIKMDDRRKHMYVIGKSGMGKSELLKTIAIQDIQDGRGIAVIDPHGELVEDLLSYVPESRLKDVIYMNPADIEHPIAFNVMEHVDFDKRHLVADGIMAVFKKIWVDAWSARMEYILNNTILALLESPDSTLLGINRMLADKDYRKQVVEKVSDPEVKAFWTQEFAKYTDKFATEATAAIQNKIGQFISNALIRNIIGQTESSFDMREAMDQNKILLVNLAKGRVGEDASRLLGALLITKIQIGAMSRIDTPKAQRNDFVLMVDEFQNFATASFANVLSEARKFNLSLILAHQYVAQMDELVQDAVFGNVGTIVSFRVGAEDAELLEREFAPEFLATDIVNLGFRQIYLKLMLNGVATKAFSAMTIDTPMPPPVSFGYQVIESSRGTYAHNRQAVESEIASWRAPVPSKEPLRPSGGPPWQSSGGSGGGGGGFAPRQQRDDRDYPPRQYNNEQRNDFRPQRDERSFQTRPHNERKDDFRPEQPAPFKPREQAPVPASVPQPIRQAQDEPVKEVPLSVLAQQPPVIKEKRPEPQSERPAAAHQAGQRPVRQNNHRPATSLRDSGKPEPIRQAHGEPKKEVDHDELRKLLQSAIGDKEN